MAAESAAVAGSALAGKAGLAVNAASAARLSGLLRALGGLHLCVEYTPKLWEQVRGVEVGCVAAVAGCWSTAASNDRQEYTNHTHRDQRLRFATESMCWSR